MTSAEETGDAIQAAETSDIARPIAIYHATPSTFSAGQTLTSPRPTTYYPSVVRELEAAKPNGAPSRLACFFAGENMAFTVSHARSTHASAASIHVYEVEIPNGWRSPVALVAAIDRGIRKAQKIGPLVAEYWNPRRQWRFIEVFGPTMEIVREVALPDSVKEMVAHISYQAEYGTADDFLSRSQ